MKASDEGKKIQAKLDQQSIPHKTDKLRIPDFSYKKSKIVLACNVEANIDISCPRGTH
jgi:hypothetical protein